MNFIISMNLLNVTVRINTSFVKHLGLHFVLHWSFLLTHYLGNFFRIWAVSCFCLCQFTAPSTVSHQFWGEGGGLWKERKLFGQCHSDCEQVTNVRCVQLPIRPEATGCTGLFMSPQRYTVINCALQKRVNYREFAGNVYQAHSGAQRSSTSPISFLSPIRPPLLLHSHFTNPWGGQGQAGDIKSLMPAVCRSSSLFGSLSGQILVEVVCITNNEKAHCNLAHQRRWASAKCGLEEIGQKMSKKSNGNEKCNF